MLYTPVAIIEKGRSARTIFRDTDNKFYLVAGVYDQPTEQLHRAFLVFTYDSIRKAMKTASSVVRGDWNVYYIQRAGGSMADWREAEEYVKEHAPHLVNEYYQTEMDFRWVSPPVDCPEFGEEVYFLGYEWGAVLEVVPVDDIGVIYNLTWKTTGNEPQTVSFTDRSALNVYIKDLEFLYGPAF